MAGEQKPPQKLPYVHGPNGTYRERSTKGMELTFAYLQTSGVHGNITGDSNNEGLYITFRSTTRAGFSFKINLAELTADDLDHLQRFILTAINTARPIAEARDKEADDAFQAGDDSNQRLHRPAPNLSVRTKSLLEYSERVQGRPDRVPPVEKPDGADSADQA